MLAFGLSLDIFKLKSLKRYAAALCPGEGSSFLTEAIARGVGYRTHASLLSALKSQESLTCHANSHEFLKFCRSKNKVVPESVLFIAMAQTAISDLRDRFPKIGEHGFGAGRPERLSGRWETGNEHYNRFQYGRKSLDSKTTAEEFLRSICLLQMTPKIKTINTKISSYGLKHIAEKLQCSYPNGEELGPFYVSNAALILAALHLGFQFKSYTDDLGWASPNVYFNISQKRVVDIDCLVRPDGARAQDRERRKNRTWFDKYIDRQIREQRKLGNPLFV